MKYVDSKKIKECKASIALDILKEFPKNQKEYDKLFYDRKTEEDYRKAEKLLDCITSTKIAMGLLNLKDRAIVSMKVYDKVHYKQIALNIGTNNKNLCNAGKKLLRDSLVNYYDLFSFVDEVGKGDSNLGMLNIETKTFTKTV